MSPPEELRAVFGADHDAVEAEPLGGGVPAATAGVWLEALAEPAWTIDGYGLTARTLERMQGTLAAALPSERWLSRRWLRAYLDLRLEMTGPRRPRRGCSRRPTDLLPPRLLPGEPVRRRRRRTYRLEADGDGAALAVRSCTSAHSRPSASGSVSGRTPWPRLKMWPGRPPARRSTSSVVASTRSHGPRRTAGSRLPCTPRSSPTSAHPRSSGMRQSRPTTSPPALRIAPSRCAVPVPKWIVGASTAARMRADHGATNSS